LPSCLLILGCAIAVSSAFGQNVDNAKLPSNEEKMKNLDALNERRDARDEYVDMERVMRKAMPMLRCLKCDSYGPCVPIGAVDLPDGCEQDVMNNLEGIAGQTNILHMCDEDY